jgi:hypothetical protein
VSGAADNGHGRVEETGVKSYGQGTKHEKTVLRCPHQIPV